MKFVDYGAALKNRIKSFVKQSIGVVVRDKTVRYREFDFQGSFQDFGFLKSLASGDREPLMTELYLNSILPSSIVFDIGAHLGQYSLLAASKTQSQRSVFAFEIHPRTYDYLIRNIKSNGFKDAIVPMYLAFSDNPGKIYVNVDMQQSDFTSINQTRSEASVKKIEIDAVNFDALKSVPVPSVIKIDVEGAEIQVLRGLRSVFKSGSGLPTVFIESNSISLENAGSSSALLVNELVKIGYNPQVIDEKEKKLVPFTSHHHSGCYNLYCASKSI